MYQPSNRSLPSAIAAVFVAALMTLAAVGPVPARAGTGAETAKPCSMATADRAARDILA